MNREAKVIWETTSMRVVLAARTHSTADKLYVIEKAVKDAMGVEGWQRLDSVMVRRGDLDSDTSAERKLLIELLEEKERL